MIISIFGESCTGKSSVAYALAAKTGAEIYTGKDYTKLAKNENDAKKKFTEMLLSAMDEGKHMIYVISEKPQLELVPEGAFRVLLKADIEIIKERFSKRMNGNMPAPVAAMLERKHGMFDSEDHDLQFSTDDSVAEDICNDILKSLG